MRPERPSRGPQPSFSRAALTEAAIRVADAEGLEAISMRRLAAEIGAGTMSLYRYVSGKDDVIELMVDAVVADYLPEGTALSGNWRADLGAMARQARRTVLRHPWLAPLAASRQGASPNRLRLLEASLRMVDGLGLGVDEMLTLIGAVFAYVNGFVQSELAEAEALRRTGLDLKGWTALQAPFMMAVIASGDFPMVARMATEGGRAYADIEERFEYGLERLLNGLATDLPRPAG
ncbi:TetR/AcrR family transcriptional regulator C-terminal domain-containing protein [Microtetraspora sp. AC03309]|uniref:TetR/AcrR family transcriptional regulator n=1 Tax=Microtetraspora sp. AC03309 TaxID=2779376 RepID=UPI001E5B26D6|nr:TetR/AcrR family transcriptional regulator [Microtetraspora sp. AC03309]MCC5577059.1 TetR/AcrR family transcriptional regulator C-terminal domain-containing protein [Microtetraspora sp. AC03309]